jgi:hypothetical protein
MIAIRGRLPRQETPPHPHKENRILTRHRLLLAGTACAGALFLGSFALGQPKQNVGAGRHPNLAAAQRMSENAYNKIIAAQEANEWDMQGHAQKAKSLLEQVNTELKAAALAANKNGK